MRRVNVLNMNSRSSNVGNNPYLSFVVIPILCDDIFLIDCNALVSVIVINEFDLFVFFVNQ